MLRGLDGGCELAGGCYLGEAIETDQGRKQDYEDDQQP